MKFAGDALSRIASSGRLAHKPPFRTPRRISSKPARWTRWAGSVFCALWNPRAAGTIWAPSLPGAFPRLKVFFWSFGKQEQQARSEEHTSELQSHVNLVCRLLLEKKKKTTKKR